METGFEKARTEAAVRNQVKSRWYYMFWGVATVAVVSGQLYIGSGYREMAHEQGRLTAALNTLLTHLAK